MIDTHVTFPRPIDSPEDTKATIEANLTAQGVTNFTVTLERADVRGLQFNIEAEETQGNKRKLRLLFGTMNTRERSRVQQERNARDAATIWRIAGGEGSFARDNPPPADAV